MRSQRLLFIGNSATYVHDLPRMLRTLAGEAGYPLEVTTVARGGYTLAQHADGTTEHGRAVLAEIQKGYDLVFLQDNGNCITTPARRLASQQACRTLDSAIRATGGITCLYIRPPYGYALGEYSPVEQCGELDGLFTGIAAELGATCAFVNRAFGIAIEELPYDLWGPDHAHLGPYGAYLAVCVFFATLFSTSSSVLSFNGLPAEAARALQGVADAVALEEKSPRGPFKG
ncbi:MAG: hypothetical protein IJX28_09055 [Clostridia bacterium]|nr:hypothetical protein [Clostridia bacterium]